MLLFLPAAALLLLYLICYRRYHEWRLCLLSAIVIWSLLIVIATEILSAVNLIKFEYILATWLLIDIVLATIHFIFLKKSIRNLRIDFNFRLSKILKILLINTAIVVPLIGLIGFVSPPNNWDSMDYHMARIVHWIQDQNIAHYPTSYIPQLYQNPWTEFVIMHFQILTGGDYFANSVAFLSLIGSLISISLIAKKLGANLSGEIFAVVTATTTIPIRVSASQNLLTDGETWLSSYYPTFCIFTLISCAKGNHK